MRDRRRAPAPRDGSAPAGERGDAPRDGGGAVLVFGTHAVEAALGNPKRRVRRVYLTDNAERRLRGALEQRQIAHERVLPKDLDRRLGADVVHQGALIEAEPLPEPTLAELADGAGSRPLLLLDQVTDPHNVGAVLRSAAVFGAGGLIMTRRHSPPLDGTLAKSASGALERIPVALVQNLARAITDLKAQGITVVGLDDEAPDIIEDMAWPAGAALVLGAEGKGLRQLTRESCDRLARITTDGPFASLSVSNAAAVALHWAAVTRLGVVATRNP
jgi:23S rRNA (guanosine2251-2'-O)-methyltransferase